MQISWVPLSPDKVGHLEILCVKWCKNAALAEHWKWNSEEWLKRWLCNSDLVKKKIKDDKIPHWFAEEKKAYSAYVVR